MGTFSMDWWDFNAAHNGVFRDTQHMIYTINGAGASMWDGYQADMARELCKSFSYFAFQPIGYDSKPAPMKPGIDAGTAEFVRQLTEVHPTGTFMGIFYSEGAIIGARVLAMLRDPTSPIAHRYKDCLAVVAFGNPCREAGSIAPGCIDPGGFGIVEPNIVDTPSWWWDFANGKNVPGAGGDDLYATCSGETGKSLQNMRDVWKTIYTGNPASMAKMIAKTILLPWKWAAGFKALSAAAAFFGSGTRPHIDYHVSYPIPGDPRDSWRIGLDYLAQVGATPVPRIIEPKPKPKPLFPPIRR